MQRRLQAQRIPEAKLILEWTESPVTRYLLYRALREIELLRDSGLSDDVYAPFEPQKTQERISNINGAIDTWEYVVEALDGKGVFDEPDFSDEN
jgi:hypothetical protein